ncbi:Rv2253 family sensor-like surface protein [Williamsia herbipolensis]
MRTPSIVRVSTTLVGMLVVGLIAGFGPAHAAEPTWTGQYSLKRFAATKTGTSLAATQREPDFADTYTFSSGCIGGVCTAAVVAGPAPANPTLPQPARYTWDGQKWVHTYDWMWDCYQGPGVPKPYNKAHSVAYYAPQPDGTFTGVWRTDIADGPCAGSVVMNVAAYPVRSSAVPFGS